jgi:hypothetical protein
MWKKNKWDPDSPIHIGWKGTWNSLDPFVTYYSDGTTSIAGQQTSNSWNTLSSQSIRLTIERYADIKIVQRKFKFYIQEKDAGRTPTKIQSCRTCKQTGKIDGWCSTSLCFEVEVSDNTTKDLYCSVHTELDLNTVQHTNRWHYRECEHGQASSHTVPKGQKCYSCNGVGKREYGNKPILTAWSGSPLRVKDGRILRATSQQSDSILERIMNNASEHIS